MDSFLHYVKDQQLCTELYMHIITFPESSAKHQFTLQDHRYSASTSHGVPVYTGIIYSKQDIILLHHSLQTRILYEHQMQDIVSM